MDFVAVGPLEQRGFVLARQVSEVLLHQVIFADVKLERLRRSLHHGRVRCDTRRAPF